MSAQTRQIEQLQRRIYDFLVKRGRVSSQIADSQPLSENLAAVVRDAIRVAKDDTIVAEAVAHAVDLPFIGLVEEGVPLQFGGISDGWMVYGDQICITNPCDSGLVNNATAWARLEQHAFTSLAVISNSYLSQLRAISAVDSEAESSSEDQQMALQVADDIIRTAARLDASDVHFLPGQTDEVLLLFRIDGILRAQRKIELVRYDTMVRAIMEQRCNIQYHSNIQQDGKFEIKLDSNKSINLRVSTLPVVRRSETSPKLVMRLLGNNASLANLDRLNLSPENYKKLVRYGNYPNGMIVMTGPTGSGKTTTLYAQLINMQNSNPNRNFHTIEDPVEMQHPGMSHTEVTKALTFADALRALLRQDPDVILVGEMRDDETAMLGYKASMTGHLVLTTLHTNNAHESIERLVNMGITIDQITGSTTAFLAQRLVRRLCPECKVEHRLKDDPERMAIYGAHPQFAALGGEARIYKAKPSGCDHCGHTGEKGRHGILEVFEMTPVAQMALLTGENPVLLRRRQLIEGTFNDLWDDGLRLVAEGCIGFSQLEGELKPYEGDRVGMKRGSSSVQAVPVSVDTSTASDSKNTANNINSI